MDIGNIHVRFVQTKLEKPFLNTLTGLLGASMKTFQNHKTEYRGYCQNLSNIHLKNVLAAEKERSETFPNDICYQASYAAAQEEMACRHLEE